MDQFCTNCGSPLEPTAKFCPSCGKERPLSTSKSMPKEADTGVDQSIPCPSCGKVLSPDDFFCTRCGRLVRDTSPPLAPAKEAAIQAKKNVKSPEKPSKKPTQKKLKKKLLSKKAWLSLTAIALVFTLTLALIIPRQVALSRDVSRQIDQPDQAIFSEEEIVAQGVISAEGGTIESADESVKMTFDELCLDDQVEAEIVHLTVDNPPEDTILNVYDFKTDSKDAITGVVTIEVPYDPGLIPAGRTAADCVSGVYYHDDLHEWIEETYTIDEARHRVLIKTNHLSAHGARIAWTDEEERLSDLFIALSKGRPDEYIIPINSERALSKLTEEEMIAVFDELKMTGIDDPQQVLNNAAMSIMGPTGSFGDIGVKTFKLTSYAGKWADFLENRLGEFSGALVLAQLASDLYYDSPQAQTYFNLIKGLTYWKGAALAVSLGGPIGGTVATVVLAGMFLYEFFWEPIDIPQYIEESNHKVVVDAYHTYYHSGENYRSKKEWMKVIDGLVTEANKKDKNSDNFDTIFRELLDKEVTAYATEFFNERASKIRQYVGDSFAIKQGYLGSYDRVYSKTDKKRNEKYVKEYVNEILAGDYDGITTSLEDELVTNLKDEVYTDIIPGVLKMRKEFQYLKQLDYFRQTQKKICQYFNTKFSLNIKDKGTEYGEISEYAGFYIAPRIIEKDSEYQGDKWIIQLDDRGQGQLNYTLFAHQMAGDFTQLNLYHKDDYDKILAGTAKPIKILDIGTITSKDHDILFGEEAIDINIRAEKEISPDLDGSVTYLFEAISDYPGQCQIRWDFGDESDPLKTDGNTSNTSHIYSREGDYTITAELLDPNDTPLAKDTITITIDTLEIDLTGNWQGTFQITDDGGLLDYAKKIGQQIGELIAKGLAMIIVPAFDGDMPSDQEISDAVEDSIEVNEDLFKPYEMAVNLTRIDEENYHAAVLTVTEEEFYYETQAKLKNGKLSFTLIHEDGSKMEFTLDVYDNTTLAGEFEIKLGIMQSLKGDVNLYR